MVTAIPSVSIAFKVQNDTLRVVNHDMLPMSQLERGMNTLTHNWRNRLNAINLQVISAGSATGTDECASDLEAARQMIASATSEVASFNRKIMPPNLSPIAYPTDYLLEDLVAAVEKKLDSAAERIDWQSKLDSGKALVDFAFFSEAMSEVLENSLRYLPANSRLIVAVCQESLMLKFSWCEQKTAMNSPDCWGKTPFLTTERGRLGLGLYFARRVLQAHGGSLAFEFSTATHILQTVVTIPLEGR